jgi:ribosomal protein L37AE/L43A
MSNEQVQEIIDRLNDKPHCKFCNEVILKPTTMGNDFCTSHCAMSFALSPIFKKNNDDK